MRLVPGCRITGTLPAVLAVAAGLAAAPLLAPPSHASAHIGARAAGGVPALVGREVAVAWQSVFVGNIGFLDRYKCTTNSGGTVYIATGVTEQGTRAELAPYASGRISCKRDYTPRVF